MKKTYNFGSYVLKGLEGGGGLKALSDMDLLQIQSGSIFCDQNAINFINLETLLFAKIR